MITWIQKTFQEHFRFVFIALLVVSIVAFIFVNNVSIGFGLFHSSAEKRPYFGINLAESGALERIQKDAITSIFFHFGSAPPKNEYLQQLAMKRFAFVHAADELRLPYPPSDEMEKRIKTLRYFKDDKGQFDASKYADFRSSPKKSTGLDMTLDDFTRAIGDDMRVDELQKLVSGPGYVLPQEVRQVIKQNETTWTLITANVDFENCRGVACDARDLNTTPKPGVASDAPTDAGESRIMAYFDKNRAKYAAAPQVRVDYIEFPSSLFLDSVKVTEKEVRAYYDANPARFPKALSITNTPQTQANDQNYALMRSNAETLLRQQRALALATTSASDFAYDLDKNGILPNTPAFDDALAKNHVSARSLPAFSKDTPPEQFGRNGAAIAKESFSLNAETRYSNPVATRQSAVILVWQESIPERPAEFSDVAGKVKTDYIKDERQNQILAMGKKLKQLVETSLKAGLPFQVAITKAAVAEGASVTTQNNAPFTLRQREARQTGPNALNIDRTLMETLRHLDQGQMSDMTVNGDTGKFIYVQSAKYSDLTESNPEYVRIERDMATRRASAAFEVFAQNLVDAELEAKPKGAGRFLSVFDFKPSY